jgi:nitroimidazol reductase NimA-like FMN-containing flavoprotein (pyridoxamine 5'-phosphate oxidase superfamily)
MDEKLEAMIMTLMDQYRIMRIATLRPDGWPQTTTVGYAHDGMTIYFLCGTTSQKAANLARDNRVSIAIDDDPDQVMEIKGLSMAAHAQVVSEAAELTKAGQLLMGGYPQQIGAPPMPTELPPDIRIFRVIPVVISVLDYSKGFAHTDLVTC